MENNEGKKEEEENIEKKEEKNEVPQEQSVEDITNSFTSVMNSFQAKLRELEEKERWWKKMEEKMKAHAEAATKKITLDVGKYIPLHPPPPSPRSLPFICICPLWPCLACISIPLGNQLS